LNLFRDNHLPIISLAGTSKAIHESSLPGSVCESEHGLHLTCFGFCKRLTDTDVWRAI
jgi:hypothetical protein